MKLSELRCAVRPNLVCNVLLVVFGIALPQLAPVTQKAFEVATIKLNNSGTDRAVQGCNGIDGGDKATPIGRCVFRNTPLKLILALAYEVPAGQTKLITGAPNWLDSERFDVEGKSEPPATQAQLHTMLQTLLMDRLKLQVHRENKELTVFALLESSGGHQMKKSDGDGPAEVRPSPAGFTAKMASMADVVAQLARDADIPVVDMTGLKDRYDFTWNIRNYFPSEGKPDPLEIMKESLPNELGLKLESRKASIQTVVIDHIEKPRQN